VRYHVQIRRGFRVARELNLEEPELRARVLTPWTRGAPVPVGGREWEPAHCELRVLAGPELTAADLAMGQGWQNAERSARDATAELLAVRPKPAAVALLAQTAAAAAAANAALERVGVQPLAWEQAAGATAALVAFDAGSGDGTDARWWLEVGRALGALGPRAVLAVHDGDVLPGPLAHAPAVRLDDADAAAQALRERLR